MEKQGELRHYQCSLVGIDHWWSVNSTSYGKAKSEFYRMLDMDGIEFTSIRCKCIGMPHTSEDFKRNAKYRNIEFAYCGMVIDVSGEKGVIVGHNSSANLDVLFTTGKNKGHVFNCHPNWQTTYYDSKGEIIKTFKASKVAS